MIPIQNNQAFLKKTSPNRIIIVAFLVWLALFIISPLKVNIHLDVNAYIFIFCSFLCFFFGGFLYKINNKREKFRPVIYKKSLSDVRFKFNIIFIIACLGLLLKFVDRFFLRGISLDANFDENREAMTAAGGNPIGILSAFLAPFCYFPLFYFYKYKFKIGKLKKLSIYILFFGQIFDSILLSSRSSIFVNLLFLLLYLLYFRIIVITAKGLFKAFFAGIAFVALMGYIYIQRTMVFAGDDPYDLILYTSNFNFTITSSDNFLTLFHSVSTAYKGMLVTYVTTLQYFVHGIFEFSYVYENFNAYNHSFGEYTFVTYYRFWTILSGAPFDSNAITNLSPRVGVYTTLLGPFFIDFGWFNLIFMCFAGFQVQRVYLRALLGIDWAVIMYFYIFIVLAFWPVFNFVNGAGGIFIFTSIIMLSYIKPKSK